MLFIEGGDVTTDTRAIQRKGLRGIGVNSSSDIWGNSPVKSSASGLFSLLGGFHNFKGLVFFK